MSNTTIAAISTPMGTGGIGIVRISGDQAISIAEQIFESNSGRLIASLSGYQGMLGRIVDRKGNSFLDEAIAYLYRAPRSYTGETVVELSCHGGVQVMNSVLRLCLDCGAELAGPGDFTKRAFLNGKMDLSQAEAVMDIIGAKGEAGLKAAAAARDGALSTEIDRIVEKLLLPSGHLAAWADYPEEDMDSVDAADLREQLEEVSGELHALLQTYDKGKILKYGIPTVLAGKPNVGKSTLMNLLSGEAKSIVTDLPGTTRDIVECEVSLGDYVLQLSDTAGIRTTDHPVEQLGVLAAQKRIASAQLIFAVFDGSAALDGEDLALLKDLENRPVIAIVNKSDLPLEVDLSVIKKSIGEVILVSARLGDGRDALEERIRGMLSLDSFDAGAAMIANERQRQCLRGAVESLQEALAALEMGITLDAVNVCIDSALDALLSLTGQRASERIIEEVFSRFCVGK